MRNFFLVLFLSISGVVTAQSFEIPSEDQPFYEVLEWKGLGMLLLSRDPSLSQKQIKISMVAGEGKTSWQQVVNPLGDVTHFIAEDGGKYAYLLENLELKSGKVFLHQISIAGNIKTNNTSFSAALKKLGDFPADELRLLDIITTEKALVYLFTHETKGKKSTLAVSMTHHNFLCYASLVAENVAGSSRVEDQVSWYVAGEKGENIIYAARTHAGKDAGWKIKEIDPKGKVVSESSLSSNGTIFVEHERVGFGRRGSALLKRVEPKEKGSLVVQNGGYFVTGVEVDNAKANLVTYQWSEGKWKEKCASPISEFNSKKGFQVGYLLLKEGCGWYVKHTQTEGHFHGANLSKGIVSGKVSQQTFNPSRLLTADFSDKFVSSLEGKWLVFDTRVLPTRGAVTLEYKQK